MMNDTVKHNGMDQPFLISRKLRLLVGVATTSTESYFLLEVWKAVLQLLHTTSLVAWVTKERVPQWDARLGSKRMLLAKTFRRIAGFVSVERLPLFQLSTVAL